MNANLALQSIKPDRQHPNPKPSACIRMWSRFRLSFPSSQGNRAWEAFNELRFSHRRFSTHQHADSTRASVGLFGGAGLKTFNLRGWDISGYGITSRRDNVENLSAHEVQKTKLQGSALG